MFEIGVIRHKNVSFLEIDAVFPVFDHHIFPVLIGLKYDKFPQIGSYHHFPIIHRLIFFG